MTITGKSYQELILTKVKAWMEEQQMQDGGAPDHTNNSTQGWRRDNFGEANVWAKTAWPPLLAGRQPALDFCAVLARPVKQPGSIYKASWRCIKNIDTIQNKRRRWTYVVTYNFYEP